MSYKSVGVGRAMGLGLAIFQCWESVRPPRDPISDGAQTNTHALRGKMTTPNAIPWERLTY